jgi:hypothetical protein
MSAALARALVRTWRRAAPALAAMPAGASAPVLSAIDAFLAAPAPAAFLGAVRALESAERAAARRRLERGSAARSVDRGIAALTAAGLDADLVAVLADQPVQRALGVRLEGLAALLEAYQELAAKAQAAALALRAQLKRR